MYVFEVFGFVIAESVLFFRVVGFGGGMFRDSRSQRKEKGSWEVELMKENAEERCFGEGS